jgi:hypothetical protein
MTVRRPAARITPHANAMNNSCVERRRNAGANSASRPRQDTGIGTVPDGGISGHSIISGVQNTIEAAPLNDHPRSAAARQRLGGLVDGGES